MVVLLVFKAHATSLDDHLALLLHQFTRQVTLIEVGGGTYARAVTQSHRSFGIALLAHEQGDDLIRECAATKNPLMTILRPREITDKQLKRFGQCEHCDIAIIHESCIKQMPRNDMSSYADILIALGDYTYIETARPALIEELKRRGLLIVAESNDSTLFYVKCPKKELSMARYTQLKLTGTRYQIISDFSRKYFKKRTLKKPLRWIHGINLMTFAMLGGIYPSDAHIGKQLEMMTELFIDHNDLVMGNMILQGIILIPIDTGDSRKSSRSSRCLKAARDAFKPGNNRLRDPEKWVQAYFNQLKNV